LLFFLSLPKVLMDRSEAVSSFSAPAYFRHFLRPWELVCEPKPAASPHPLFQVFPTACRHCRRLGNLTHPLTHNRSVLFLKTFLSSTISRAICPRRPPLMCACICMHSAIPVLSSPAHARYGTRTTSRVVDAPGQRHCARMLTSDALYTHHLAHTCIVQPLRGSR